MQTKKYKWMHT